MSSEKTPTTVVLATALFGVSPHWLLTPAGHVEDFEAILRDNPDPTEGFIVEYGSIVATLAAMELPFAILEVSGKEIDPHMKEGLVQTLGVKRFVTLPHLKFCGEALWPRDIATWLPRGTLLINQEAILKYTADELGRRVRTKPSHYGEGGRILQSDNLAVVFSRVYQEEHQIMIADEKPQPAPIHELQKEGLTVVSLLEALHHNQVGKSWYPYSPANHVDRFMGLLRAPDGTPHLILDPKIVSGFKDIDRPLFANAQTLRTYKSVCEQAGIQVHVPSKLSVPLSLGFVQFSTGQVMVTGGDDEVADIIAGIVGGNNTFCTPVPIRTFPVRSYAGLRCLVNEWPDNILVPSGKA